MHRESAMVMGHNTVPMLPPLLVVPIFRWQSSVRVDSRVLFCPTALLDFRRKGHNMKIKYQIIAQNVEIEVNNDWSNLFIDLHHREDIINNIEIRQQSQTHHLIVWVLTNVLLPILVNIIVNITWSVIGQVLFPTNVNEEPHIFSQVVYHTELHQNIEVLGNVPYYFEVEIQDESSGCRYAGCVSESSISLIESEEKWIGLE